MHKNRNTGKHKHYMEKQNVTTLTISKKRKTRIICQTRTEQKKIIFGKQNKIYNRNYLWN